MKPDMLDVLLSRADPALAPRLTPLVDELRREYGGDTVYLRQYVQPVAGNQRTVIKYMTRRTVQNRRLKANLEPMQ